MKTRALSLSPTLTSDHRTIGPSNSKTLQALVLLFAYLHCAILFVALGIERTTARVDVKRKHRLTLIDVCSLWQVATMIVSMAGAIFFMSLDGDHLAKLPLCSLLLSFRNPFVNFSIITLLIVLHLLAIVGVYIAACIQHTNSTYRPGSTSPKCQRRGWKSFVPQQVISIKKLKMLKVRNVLTIESVLWGLSFCCTGVGLIYDLVTQDKCFYCMYLALECSFTLLPLLIAFSHPFLVIWHVDTIRDRLALMCPCIGLFLPDYAMPKPSPLTSSNLSFRTSSASEYLDITIEKPEDGEMTDVWKVSESIKR